MLLLHLASGIRLLLLDHVVFGVTQVFCQSNRRCREVSRLLVLVLRGAHLILLDCSMFVCGTAVAPEGRDFGR